MQLFEVYSRFDVHLEKGQGSYVYDAQGQAYLDLYGGHGVISIGHQHPTFVERLTRQLQGLSYYSNSVHMDIQAELAWQLGQSSGYTDHQLFLCNSGAEANENALKLASFHTGRKKLVAFRNSFHGRTAAALQVTDNPKLRAPINQDNFPVEYLPLNDFEAAKTALQADDVAAVIVEGIQGVGGLDAPSATFLQFLSQICQNTGTMLIMDEIQSGFGRTGHFFAHQIAGIQADLVTVAKGMGNGFPVAGVLVGPQIKAKTGQLGTTFGGNPLACAAALSVLEVLNSFDWKTHVTALGNMLHQQLLQIPEVERVKGRGLMLGAELNQPAKSVRQGLLHAHHILTGGSANPKLLRILPALTISEDQIRTFPAALHQYLQHAPVHQPG